MLCPLSSLAHSVSSMHSVILVSLEQGLLVVYTPSDASLGVTIKMPGGFTTVHTWLYAVDRQGCAGAVLTCISVLASTYAASCLLPFLARAKCGFSEGAYSCTQRASCVMAVRLVQVLDSSASGVLEQGH